MAQGDVPMSRGGPLRRRREKRQLEQLADSSGREEQPRPAAAHVRVIEDQAVAVPRDDTPKPDAPDEGPVQIRSTGFHVRAVPIDQPFDE